MDLWIGRQALKERQEDAQELLPQHSYLFSQYSLLDLENPPPNGFPSGPPVLQQSSGNEPKPPEPIAKTSSKSKKAYLRFD